MGINEYVRPTVALVSRELKHWYRSKVQILMTLLMPLMWLGLFGQAMGGFIDNMAPEGLDYFSFMAVGMIVVTALTTSMNAGMSVVWDRRFGFLDKLKAAPIPRGVIHLSRVLASTVKSTIQSMLVLLVALPLGLKLAPDFGIVDVFVVIVAVILLSLTFSSVFVSFGLVIKNQETLMVVNMLLNLPLMFASGALFPIDYMPSWLKTVASLNPLTYAADAVRRATITVPPILSSSLTLSQDLLILAAVAFLVTSLGMALSNRGLRA
ncbi:MAG: type transport system permease protein [Candidatus Methanomethylophilaceae archaeon]|nr:type transport system permease protein [Candidatus Methanomethylophilaceae archaeon]